MTETGGRKQFGTVFDIKSMYRRTMARLKGYAKSGARGTNGGSKATNNGSPTAHVSATSQFRERSEPSFVSEANKIENFKKT